MSIIILATISTTQENNDV
ncbi:hypothetical protein AB2F68_02385 [Escherichia coli]